MSCNPVVDTCEHGNEPLSSIKGEKFIHQMSDCQFPKKSFVPQSYSLFKT
jgi:hypothetical protein